MRKVWFAILLIPLLGFAALVAGARDSMAPQIQEDFDRFSVQIFVILFAVFVVVFAWRKISRAFQVKPGKYVPPQVIGARVGDGFGELTITALNSTDVRERLKLPRGSKIITIAPNEVYRVELPSDRRAVIERVARANGYIGEVG